MHTTIHFLRAQKCKKASLNFKELWKVHIKLWENIWIVWFVWKMCCKIFLSVFYCKSSREFVSFFSPFPFLASMGFSGHFFEVKFWEDLSWGIRYFRKGIHLHFQQTDKRTNGETMGHSLRAFLLYLEYWTLQKLRESLNGRKVNDKPWLTHSWYDFYYKNHLEKTR